MPLLEVKSLVKTYGRRRVVDGINFEVEPGEVVGLLGPNGAGKTTSFRMTTGQTSPNSGQVWFNGSDVTHLPMYRRARLGMGYLPQETSVFRRLNVEQNILSILEVLPKARSLGRALNRRERRERTELVLEQFGLTHVRKNNASRLSGGEKRRLEIARCLVCEPMLILLDEPFTGIDPKTISDIQNIVIQLRNQGIGLLLTDHNVREALKITDRSYLIKDGKVRTHGSPREILHDEIAISEYLGREFHRDVLSEHEANSSNKKSTISTTQDGSPVNISPLTSRPKPSISVPSKQTQSEPSQQSQTVQPRTMTQTEKMTQLVALLKNPTHKDAATKTLTDMGTAAVPYLLNALELRDVELRYQAQEILQTIYNAPIPFDPYAPEAMRKQQIQALRERWLRKAG